MTQTSLEKILNKQSISVRVREILYACDPGACIKDADGHILLGQGSRGGRRFPVRMGSVQIGWVAGGSGASAVASVLNLICEMEDEKRGLVREMMEIYTELCLLYDQLQSRSKPLEETGPAPAGMMKKEAEAREGFGNNGLSNRDPRVRPVLNKPGQPSVRRPQRIYFEIIESGLKEVFSPLAHGLSLKTMKFTYCEMQVAEHIRSGRNTKEIAGLMGVSPRTVEFHRRNIRIKMGLQHSKANLKAYLACLP